MNVLMISVDSLNDTQRAQIQRLVQIEAQDWWHRQENLWLVVSPEGAHAWRAKLTPIIHEPPNSVLVLTLDASKGWAGRRAGGIDKLGADWMKEYFGKKPIE